jgi:hypothetical protein
VAVRAVPGRAARSAVAAVLVAAALLGCTGDDDDADPPVTTAAPSSPEALPPDEADAGEDDAGTDAEDETDADAEDGTDADGAADADGTGDTATVLVFFDDPDRGPDPQVFPVERTVAAPAVLRGALEELLAGPTAEERAEGYHSFFSSETADQLVDVSIEAGVAEVAFSSELPELIPNASTSAGSASLLGALDATTTQFDSVDRAIYSLEGDVDAFYEWLQLVPPA